MGFVELAQGKVAEKGSRVVVGIDPRLERIPPALRGDGFSHLLPYQSAAEIFYEFSRRIIGAVEPHVVGVKFQLAFFEQLGSPGIAALERLTRLAREMGLLVIMDAKRGDIGSTAEAYANAFLGRFRLGEVEVEAPLKADAITLNPYLGLESLGPFMERAEAGGAGLFVLLHSTNPGAEQVQEKVLFTGEPLYLALALEIEAHNQEHAGEGGFGLLGAVVGATYPEKLATLRQLMPHTFFLIPGYGAQGAGPAEVKRGFLEGGRGALVAASRSVIFAWEKDPTDPQGVGFDRAAAEAAEEMKLAINRALGLV